MKDNFQLSTVNSQLPKGWEVKKLGDVCEVQRGLTYSGKDAVDHSNIIVLRATNINLKSSSLDFTELKYLRDDFIIKDKYRLRKDSLLICFSSGSKSHLGKVALVDDNYDYAFGGFIGQINPNEEINSKYLFYSLISEKYKQYILELTDGININNLKIKDLQNFPIPIPPLPEQQRIVEILDKAFVAIDKAKQNAEQNLRNAKEVFQSKLQAIFDNGKLKVENGEWEECLLNDNVKFIDYRGRTPKKTSSGIRLITAKNIKKGHLQKNPEEFIAEKDYDSWMSRGIPRYKDVIFTTEAPLANVAQLETKEKVAFAQRTIVFQPDLEQINQTFLKYLILSKPYQNVIISQGTGATVKGIKSSLLKKIKISYPKSMQEQEQIVADLDQLQAETKHLEEIYQQKLKNLGELKKSILQKAFKGKL